MSKQLRAVKGMNDITPETSFLWERLEQAVREVLQLSGYRNMRTPIVEPTALYVRGLGEVTDIVEKEMYSFEDRLNGDQLTLRPEGTAGMVRAVSQHGMLHGGGQRLYYMGPMFRHERPQRGRYRQFHQVGAEALGFAGAEVDVELIAMAQTLWQQLGIQGVRLEINSLGQPQERQAHREALIAYFEQHQDMLDEDARRRLHSNPLRILDTKNPAMQELVNAAPVLSDCLTEASQAHFQQLRDLLDAHGIAYRINPRLVRGMDYYNLTVFEFISEELGAQGTICGGGRYDYLMEMLGGKPAPAVGWALGAERVLELMQQRADVVPAVPDACAVVGDVAAFVQVMPVLHALRQQGVSVVMNSSNDQGRQPSFKAQFKRANASGARYALIFGGDELAAGRLACKPLLTDEQQFDWPLNDMQGLADRLKANGTDSGSGGSN